MGGKGNGVSKTGDRIEAGFFTYYGTALENPSGSYHKPTRLKDRHPRFRRPGSGNSKKPHQENPEKPPGMA